MARRAASEPLQTFLLTGICRADYIIEEARLANLAD